jgi:hypothetical protein
MPLHDQTCYMLLAAANTQNHAALPVQSHQISQHQAKPHPAEWANFPEPTLVPQALSQAACHQHKCRPACSRQALLL